MRESTSQQQKEIVRKKDVRSKMGGKTVKDRRRRFIDKVKYGPIFPCVSCEQLLFENGVKSITDDLKKKLEVSPLVRSVVNKNLNSDRFRVTRTFLIDNEREEKKSFYECHTCLGYLNKKKMPPIAATNKLDVVNLPEEFQNLSTLEESLVARKLIFQKIFPLRLSRMPAVKDKLIMIPMEEDDILNTLQNFPRIPSEAGIIDVQWKRKMAMKNHFMQAKVNIERIYRFFKVLKNMANPHYQFWDDIDVYKEKFFSTDNNSVHKTRGKGRVFRGTKVVVKFVDDEYVAHIIDIKHYLKELKEKEEEERYKKR